jgi:D-glycero-D-manno-heptose 1,7-bisphosphate phosphatase
MNKTTQKQPTDRSQEAAVFLDRDGTIIHDCGYIKKPSEVVFYPQAFYALRLLQPHFELFIVTNQVGIAKGILKANEVERINQRVASVLADQGVRIRDTYVCTHTREDNCSCRKPKPFFLEQAADRYGIDLKGSFTIGDHTCDVQLAHNAGACGLYVLTGHGSKHTRELPQQTSMLVDILAADYVLSLRHWAKKENDANN